MKWTRNEQVDGRAPRDPHQGYKNPGEGDEGNDQSAEADLPDEVGGIPGSTRRSLPVAYFHCRNIPTPIAREILHSNTIAPSGHTWKNHPRTRWKREEGPQT